MSDGLTREFEVVSVEAEVRCGVVGSEVRKRPALNGVGDTCKSQGSGWQERATASRGDSRERFVLVCVADGDGTHKHTANDAISLADGVRGCRGDPDQLNLSVENMVTPVCKMTSDDSGAHISNEYPISYAKENPGCKSSGECLGKMEELDEENNNDLVRKSIKDAAVKSTVPERDHSNRNHIATKERGKIRVITTPIGNKTQNSCERKPNRKIIRKTWKTAREAASPIGAKNTKRCEKGRRSLGCGGPWMRARLLILSSIWILRVLSDKMLVMAVLASVLSSTLPSTTLASAESAKASDKGVAPVFLEPVPNVTVAVGREASLTCSVDHLGMHKVAWIHLDRQMILSIHNHIITRTPRFGVTHDSHKTWTLHVTEVKEEDRGHYMCQVNTKPMISQTGFLQVVVPPNIVDDESSPSSIVVREKDEVTLTCKGEGFPLPHIKWRREDGQTIETSDGRKVAHLDGQSLPLHQVSRMDMGAYLCIASNGVPPSVSKRITLDVEFSPQMHVPNQLVGAPLSTDVRIECFVEAHPRAITYWEFEGAMVMNTSRISTDTLEDLYRIHMILSIKDLQESDFGTYKCISKNSIAETDGSITLNKTFKPTSPPQTMLHSSDDDGKSHLTRGRAGSEQQRKQLEASRRRFQEEDPVRRMDEEGRRRGHHDPNNNSNNNNNSNRKKYERDPNHNYRDDITNRMSNQPINNDVSRWHFTSSTLLCLSLQALLLL